jgi:uncharacterized metal-binding protein YceD (DUF177 family)
VDVVTARAGQPRSAAEFSRRVRVDSISDRALEVKIEASAAERQGLAERFQLQRVDRLAATVTLQKVRGEMVKATGTLSADVVQTCVLTLEPVANHVEDSFEALFAPPHLQGSDSVEEVELDIHAEDPPEPIVGGGIDIGELTAQYLSLALDPYPRCPEAAIEEAPGEGSGQTDKVSPFAALAKLRRNA